ncbi:MAG: 3-deoxy-7-phosphoheptulonate synthase [Anaerolineae bacterium]|nr:3-deoxy-7-phosphoheptulonate synthase [Thermoflexus sp.]MDW8065063.1 3-deoxy-7-phosphoheptulonate synthase [Anaerolineae bacterium]
MIVECTADADPRSVQRLVDHLRSRGKLVHWVHGPQPVLVCPDERDLDPRELQAWPGVQRVIPIRHAFQLASRDYRPEGTKIRVGDIRIGDGEPVLIAGPCAIESRTQLLETAHAVREAGAHMFRAGAFKPRTSPYSFQGLGFEGLTLLAEVRAETGLPVVTEVMAPEEVPLVAEVADILQIGTRNMQNFSLLRAVARQPKPVLLKRGMSATIEEWLLAAEYVMAYGNFSVILCERGIRTFERMTRNTLDINAVPVAKRLSHLPVLADPSHGTGEAAYVIPVARAAIAAGADGLLVEVHVRPEEAWSDGRQSLTPEAFARMVREVRAVSRALRMIQ